MCNSIIVQQWLGWENRRGPGSLTFSCFLPSGLCRHQCWSRGGAGLPTQTLWSQLSPPTLLLWRVNLSWLSWDFLPHWLQRPWKFDLFLWNPLKFSNDHHSWVPRYCRKHFNKIKGHPVESFPSYWSDKHERNSMYSHIDIVPTSDASPRPTSVNSTSIQAPFPTSSTYKPRNAPVSHYSAIKIQTHGGCFHFSLFQYYFLWLQNQFSSKSKALK